MSSCTSYRPSRLLSVVQPHHGMACFSVKETATALKHKLRLVRSTTVLWLRQVTQNSGMFPGKHQQTSADNLKSSMKPRLCLLASQHPASRIKEFATSLKSKRAHMPAMKVPILRSSIPLSDLLANPAVKLSFMTSTFRYGPCSIYAPRYELGRAVCHTFEHTNAQSLSTTQVELHSWSFNGSNIVTGSPTNSKPRLKLCSPWSS